MHKLSIIIPIYGVEKYLPTCLDSVYSQATDECQVILVDDASPDNCGRICEEYKARYPENTIVIHQENMGLGGARNTGMGKADGEYLFFIDSDDYIPDGTIPCLLESIERFGADVFVFPFFLVDEEGNDLGFGKDSLPTLIPLSAKEDKRILTSIPNAWNKVARASLYKDNDISFPSRVWYEDIRTTPKLLLCADSVVYLEKKMYYYLQREGSIMSSAKVDRNVEIIEALDDLIGWFKKEGHYEEYRQEIDYLLIDHVFIAATVRVIKSAGTSHPLVAKLRSFTLKNCLPDAMKSNHYVRNIMPKNRKLIMKLLSSRLYLAVKLIFKVKG